MSYAQQSNDAGRHIMPDLVRAFAIIGIAVVNVGLFAYAMDLSYFDGGYQTQSDKGAVFLVYSLFMMKSYTLFSFMFGVGFAYQIQSAKQAEAGFGGRYFRRIIGLLILGVAHIAYGFQGDILLLYGLLGAALFLFRNSSVKKMVVVGITGTKGKSTTAEMLFAILRHTNPIYFPRHESGCFAPRRLRR